MLHRLGELRALKKLPSVDHGMPRCLRTWLSSLILAWLLAAGTDAQQVPTSGAAPQPDFSQEAFIVERLAEKVRYEDDGTGWYRKQARYRVQAEAAVQQLGLLLFGYDRATQQLEIAHVRIHKADGSIVETPTASAQEFPAQITRIAPMYTDFREKHVTVSALRPGDILEFDVTIRTHTPLVPGHFWLEVAFEKNVIVLDHQVEADIPAQRPLTIKAVPESQPGVEEEGDRRLYRWRAQNLQRPPAKPRETRPWQPQELEPRSPDVQLSTFQTWEEFGQWYRAIQQEQEVVSPEIQAKAEELTRGLVTDADKVQALYDFVSQEFRYISLSFGIGRLQPHQAAEVFANRYGDCKDKHTLLAAMLKAVGLKAYPVLIHSQRTLDPAVPSPAQFDHLITAVPLADGLVWLDTTTEVAPYGLLGSYLRKKQALLMPDDAPPSLVETPAQPPFPRAVTLEVEGKVTELAKVEASIRQTFRGDDELLLRQAFRRTPRNQWQNLAQMVALGTGYGGEVSDVNTSDPGNTREPFRLEYKYTRDNYVEWRGPVGTMRIALPDLGLPRVDEEVAESSKPMELGPPGEITYRSTMQIPPGTTAVQPLDVVVSRDYAHYTATYRVAGPTVTIERHLRILEPEITASRRSDYLAFYRVASQDQQQDLRLLRDPSQVAQAPSTANPDELWENANQALRRGELEAGIQTLEKLVEVSPDHPSAWGRLGQVRLLRMELEPAIRALENQLKANPFHEDAHLNLALAFLMKGDFAAAEPAAQRQLEVNPLDYRARFVLAQIYRETQRPAEALPYLEAVATQRPEDGQVMQSLAETYLEAGFNDKALATLEDLARLHPTPLTWNNLAYLLAEKNAHLDRAQQWAEQAVMEMSAQLQAVKLSELTREKLATVAQLVAAWDTLGWVYARQGAVQKAESYLAAAWATVQDAVIAEHLAQVYERTGQKAKAKLLRDLIEAAPPRRPRRFHEFYQLYVGGQRLELNRPNLRSVEQLQNMRTIKLKRRLKASESAEFYVLLAPGSTVEDARFISGSENLKDWSETLKTTAFPVAFPDDLPAKIVRRGILSCAQYSGECIFVMYELNRMISLE